MTDLNPEQFDLMWLQFAALGAERERERIIELLESLDCGDATCIHDECCFSEDAIALIKGEQK